MSIFFQTALSLAVAEECLEFEHRDLHIGNLLIDKCPAHETIRLVTLPASFRSRALGCIRALPSHFRYVLNGKEFILKSHGVRVSIIDFNNSRIRKGWEDFFNVAKLMHPWRFSHFQLARPYSSTSPTMRSCSKALATTSSTFTASCETRTLAIG